MYSYKLKFIFDLLLIYLFYKLEFIYWFLIYTYIFIVYIYWYCNTYKKYVFNTNKEIYTDDWWILLLQNWILT